MADALSKRVYRQLFTETEWDAIFDAICEFQDHGEDEHLISHTIQMKIRELFEE
jgi:hypothetical protein